MLQPTRWYLFKKIYRKVTAGESLDGDSSVDEKEEETSDDDIENWTDVDSEGESEDDSTGSYEDVTIKVLYMGDKKVINMYRENSDIYKATLSERGLECLQASGHDVDLDKVVSTGFSGGSLFNTLLLSHRSDSLAAVAEMMKRRSYQIVS